MNNNYPLNVAKNLIANGYELKGAIAQTGDLIYQNANGDLRILYNKSLKSKKANEIANSFSYPNAKIQSKEVCKVQSEKLKVVMGKNKSASVERAM